MKRIKPHSNRKYRPPQGYGAQGVKPEHVHPRRLRE